MKTAVPLLLDADIIVLALGFIIGLAAHIQLQFCIDFARVKKETGQPGWKILGSVLAPTEFYKPEAHRMWKLRDRGLKTFAIGVGVLVVIAGVAAVADVPLQ